MHITQTDGGSRSKKWRPTNLSFAPCSFQLHQRIQEKPAITGVDCVSCDRNCRLAQHAYFAEQLSLRRCAVRYKRVRTRSRIARVDAKRSTNAGVRWAQTVEVRAVPGDVEETITASCPDKAFRFDDNCFGRVTASAVLTKCDCLPMPRFRQTCGRKCRTPCGGRSAKRGLLNNSQ